MSGDSKSEPVLEIDALHNHLRQRYASLMQLKRPCGVIDVLMNTSWNHVLDLVSPILGEH